MWTAPYKSQTRGTVWHFSFHFDKKNNDLGHHNGHIIDSEQGADLLPASPLGLLLGGALHQHHCGLGAGRPRPVHSEGVSPENMRGEINYVSGVILCVLVLTLGPEAWRHLCLSSSPPRRFLESITYKISEQRQRINFQIRQIIQFTKEIMV